MSDPTCLVRILVSVQDLTSNGLVLYGTVWLSGDISKQRHKQAAQRQGSLVLGFAFFVLFYSRRTNARKA